MVSSNRVARRRRDYDGQRSNTKGGQSYVNEEQNNAIPAMLRRIPNQSNLFIVSRLNPSVSACVLGTVHIAAKKNATYIMAIR